MTNARHLTILLNGTPHFGPLRKSLEAGNGGFEDHWRHAIAENEAKRLVLRMLCSHRFAQS